MIQISEISALETFSVRLPVLRPGKPIESCHFEGDDLETTKHFGLFENEILAGIISVFKQNHAAFANDNQFQIRGMAVLENFRKHGFGEQLVRHVENYVKEQNGDLIWFNAREAAVKFYSNLDYQIVGGAFDIPDVGIHYMMYKILD